MLPSFTFIRNKYIIDSFVSGDFLFVSMKIYNFIKLIENNSIMEKEESDSNDKIIEKII